MRLKKLVALGLLTTMATTTLTGCGNNDEYSSLSNVVALGGESSVNSSNYQLSYTEQQELVYAQVSNKTLLDLSYFNKVTPDARKMVESYMDDVDNVLMGNVPASTLTSILDYLETKDEHQTIKLDYANYITYLFEHTPYYWQRTSMDIIGESSISGYIVCDVHYKTIGYNKDVIRKSTIPLGSPLYEKLTMNRYNLWCEILRVANQNNIKLAELAGGAHRNSSNSRLAELQDDYDKWVAAFGDPAYVYEEQSRYTGMKCNSVDYTFRHKNQFTYPGAIDSVAEDTDATMTIRYVLKADVVLGINRGYTCANAYVTEYKVDNDVTNDKVPFNSEGYSTVSDAVYELMYSYFKCIDESNHLGLYSLVQNYDEVDKFYDDRFRYSINKHNAFSITLFDITGTHITCGVTVSNKQRAKGSEMSAPIYTDRYYVEIDLIGDKLKISNIMLLSKKLDGEPSIDSVKLDTSGFTQSISLSDDDKKQIEGQINKFGIYQLNGDSMSTGLEEIIDYSMSNASLNAVKKDMLSITGTKKVVFLQNYVQGANGYAVVKCRELFQAEDGSITEAIVQYTLMVKGKTWYITGYQVMSMFKTGSTQLNATGCLSLLNNKEVEAYNSQVSAPSKSEDEKNDNIETVKYKNYNPSTGAVQQESLITAFNNVSITEEQRLLIDKNYETNINTILGYDDKINAMVAVASKYNLGTIGTAKDAAETYRTLVDLNYFIKYDDKGKSLYAEDASEYNSVVAVIEQYQQTIDKLDRDIASITDFTNDEKKTVTDYTTVLMDIYSKYSKLKG